MWMAGPKHNSRIISNTIIHANTMHYRGFKGHNKIAYR